MTSFISHLNKAFESRVRLGIMSLLMIHDQLDFSALKNQLAITDGNMASHMTALEKLKYIQVQKKFIGKKPNTTYSATPSGKKAFQSHLAALEAIIHQRNNSSTSKK
ncbi:MAG: transcriptional regulator [Chitinophagaceae bacterium]|nr:transcriptional regulator [Chitinophagaceae bacterium]MCA6512450.1 transcriptional regulator [Chitinophagaceae bacterium]